MTTPQRIGRYQIHERIGSGGFATVWRAYDAELDNQVAVKILAENWIERSDIRTRFVEEARMLRRADSDRVVRVHDIGNLDDGRPYFVMSYADRRTLTDRLADGPLPLAAALGYARDAARGVAILHGLGVLHRDLKPSNILFRSTADGEQLMIADLGLAKAMAHASGFTVAAGTPGYMAPEQSSVGGDLDGRADVYALGAMTYQMLTGRKPASTADRVLPPSGVRGDLPPDTDLLVLRALERDRERRWPDADAFAQAAGRLLDPPTSPHPAAAQPPSPAPVQEPPQVTHQPPPPSFTSLAQPTAHPTQQPQPQQPRAATTPPAQQPGGPPQPQPQNGPPTVAPRRPPARGSKPPGGRRGRRLLLRVLLVTGTPVLAVILLLVGSTAWYYTSSREVRTGNDSVVFEAPRSWQDDGAVVRTGDMGEYGGPGARGVVVTAPADTLSLDESPSVTVVASKAFAGISDKAFTRTPGRTAWSPSCDDETSDTRLTKDALPSGFTSGTLRTWRSDCASHWYHRAVLAGADAGAQVFVVTDTDDDETAAEIVASMRLDPKRLP